MEPRRLQNRAQSTPERKKSDQKRQQVQQDAKNAPKTRPRQVWEAPRPLRKRARQAPRRMLATIVIGSLLHKGVGTIFHDFCVTRNQNRFALQYLFQNRLVVVFVIFLKKYHTRSNEHFNSVNQDPKKKDETETQKVPKVLSNFPKKINFFNN